MNKHIKSGIATLFFIPLWYYKTTPALNIHSDDSCNIRTRFLNYPDTRSSIIRTSILETYGQLFLKYADSYS